MDRDWMFDDPASMDAGSGDRNEVVHPDSGHGRSGPAPERPEEGSGQESTLPPGADQNTDSVDDVQGMEFGIDDFAAAVTATGFGSGPTPETPSKYEPEPEPEDEPVWEAPLGGLESVRELLYRGDEAVLILPAEVFVYFYPAGPEQVINAVLAAGFRALHFESLGDELVALEYLRLWRENSEKRTWIRSTSLLVVEYCQTKHPELLPYLAPIVPPAVALARYLRHQGESAEHLVYAGLDVPEVNGERQFSAALSFLDLERLLEERGADPHAQPLLLQQLPPERRRFLSTAGGLPLPMLDEERASSRYFRTLRGLHSLAALSRLVEDNGVDLGFVDILPFDGALDHPALGPHEQLYWRRSILELAEPERASGPVIDIPPGLDLSVSYGPKQNGLPAGEIGEIERVLEEVQSQANGVVWEHTARDYAGYLSLAESLMRRRPELAVGLLHMSRNYFRAVRDATHDALTDLYSYRALVERAREELGQANRASAKLAMLFVDLDNFKEINDRYGHPVGNDILRRVARALELAIRSTDIAGRFGGDEFVVLLVDADFEGAVRVADQIRHNVAEIRVPVPDGDVGTSASIGIAAHAGSEDSLLTADDLFAEADAALYIAKAHGGNRVHPVVRGGTPQ